MHPNSGFVFDHSSTSSQEDSHTPQRRSLDSHGQDDSIVSTPIKPWAQSRLTSRNSSALQLAKERESQRYFRSRRINKDDVQQPWKAHKDPREKWVTIIPLIGLALGFCFAGFLVYDGLRTIVNHKYTLVFEDNFATFNDKLWQKESNVGGFG